MHELEQLRWNLAGCLTIAEAQKPTEFNEDFALPALKAVNAMAKLLDELRNTCRGMADRLTEYCQELRTDGQHAESGNIELIRNTLLKAAK